MKVLKFLDENIESIICVVLLACMSILIVTQVFFRYVLQNSLSWSEELARYMFIWLIYIGISYGVKMRKHICVDAVYAAMPKKVKPFYGIIGDLLFLAFAVLVVYYGIDVMQQVTAQGQVSPASHMPMGIVYSAPWVGMILTSIRLIQNIAGDIKKIVKHEIDYDAL